MVSLMAGQSKREIVKKRQWNQWDETELLACLSQGAESANKEKCEHLHLKAETPVLSSPVLAGTPRRHEVCVYLRRHQGSQPATALT